MSLSKMMQQYLEIKEQYKDAILFFRLGDFYEMFYDDAILASRELELTLTGRNCGMPDRAPMCGVPYHAVNTYLAKLIEKGYKVAICEQVSLPGNGIVKREVVKVVTPGTVSDGTLLSEDRNNYIASICMRDNKVGAAWMDLSTGEFHYSFIDAQIALRLNETLSRIEPKEILCNGEMMAESINLSIVKYGAVCPFSAYDETKFDISNAEEQVRSFFPDCLAQLKKVSQCLCAAGALLAYIHQVQKKKVNHLSSPNRVAESEFMAIDHNARRALELTASMADGKKHGSLLWAIDRTATNMGSRLLRQWVEQPIVDETEINKRLDFTEELVNNTVIRGELRENLQGVYDIERLSGRLSCDYMQPKDCYNLAASFEKVPQIKALLSKCSSALANEFNEKIQSFDDIVSSVMRGIQPGCGNIRDGGVISDGYDAELDEYRNLRLNSKGVLANLESLEKEETGIKNLRIAYNRVFGYYIEVLKSQQDLVPYRYVRKQTVANCERYITEELKEIEEKILSAEERALTRETLLYDEILNRVREHSAEMIETARLIAYLDCIQSLATVSAENNFVKPIVSKSSNRIKITEGRHCVVEKLLKGEDFVPNDTLLDDDENKLMLITGPNMAGKSIYMRQVAVITVMAHIGCFVPAAAAEIAVTDKIYTRVGASDDLSTGRSTFMVEMNEVSQILAGATDRSLILMDEIGRGTSTFDGLSIAWAIIEFLSAHTKAKILFSTHYHELTDLEDRVSGLKNYKLAVREFNNSIIFLRKVMRGSANRSFGIEVAGIAGLPDEVLARAKSILKMLESADIGKKTKLPDSKQLDLFSGSSRLSEVKSILLDLDLDSVSPRQALDILGDLKEKVSVDE